MNDTIIIKKAFGYSETNFEWELLNEETMEKIGEISIYNDNAWSAKDYVGNLDNAISLWSFGIRPAFRRMGYGSYLMEKVIETYSDKDIVLLASPINRQFISLKDLVLFYEHLGFEVVKPYANHDIEELNASIIPMVRKHC